jgi:hypothetical protein
MTHVFGIIGLIVNMAATVLLLRFPPSVREYTADGAPIVAWKGTASDAGKRKFRFRRDGYKFAIALLLLGFFLQLLDLLVT